jgi:two-component sensor histidine kinase
MAIEQLKSKMLADLNTPFWRYGAAVSLIVLIAYLRWLGSPSLGSGAYFILYFPALAWIAYALGVGPVVVSILVALGFSYFVFTPTDLRTEPVVPLRMGLYLVSAAAVAFLVVRVRERLDYLARNLADVSAQTRGQADLFREHAERVSNHLQLISALLQLQARDETGPQSARVLHNAASRTMLISRMHRAFSNPADEPVEFAAFAELLADSALESHGRPPLSISVEGQLKLTPEHATSLALVLLECISARVRQEPRGLMRIQLSERGRDGVLTIAEEGMSGPRSRDTHLLGALAEQLEGRLVLGANEQREQLRLTFPTDIMPLSKWDPITPLN